jgi:hypothetical protein
LLGRALPRAAALGNGIRAIWVALESPVHHRAIIPKFDDLPCSLGKIHLVVMLADALLIAEKCTLTRHRRSGSNSAWQIRVGGWRRLRKRPESEAVGSAQDNRPANHSAP